jgi:pilus assembly protein TadC
MLNKEIVVSFLSGLLPVVLTFAFNWLEQRDEESQRSKVIDVATKRMQWLDAYLNIQKNVLSPEQLEVVRYEVSREVEQVYQELKDDLRQIEKILLKSKKDSFQQVFLTYKMKSRMANACRFAYYIFFAFAILFSIFMVSSVLTSSNTTQLAKIFVMIFSIFLNPFWLVTLLFRWLAKKLDRREEKYLIIESV